MCVKSFGQPDTDSKSCMSGCGGEDMIGVEEAGAGSRDDVMRKGSPLREEWRKEERHYTLGRDGANRMAAALRTEHAMRRSSSQETRNITVMRHVLRHLLLYFKRNFYEARNQ